MNTNAIIRNVCVISVTFLLASMAYAAPGGSKPAKITLGSLSPCLAGQIAKYNGSTWNCVADEVASGGSASPQFEVKDDTLTPPEASQTVGTFVGFSGPNIAQVLVEVDIDGAGTMENFLLEATTNGFLAHPRVNVNPDFSGDSRRPVIYYYSDNSCGDSGSANVYTHPGNFDPPYGGGFASALSESGGYVVVLENENVALEEEDANLYLDPGGSGTTATFNSVRYMGRCLNNVLDIGNLDINDYYALPLDAAGCTFGVTGCSADSVVQLNAPIVNLHSGFFTPPFTLIQIP